jgi:hypothetical protein
LESVIRITLVIINIEYGGAERVVSMMADHWASRGWEVTVLTFVDSSAPPFYELDSRVRLRPLGIYQTSSAFLADGPLRSDIASLHDELGLGERLHLPGTVKNDLCVLRQADLFVLSSKWEDFPNSFL